MRTSVLLLLALALGGAAGFDARALGGAAGGRNVLASDTKAANDAVDGPNEGLASETAMPDALFRPCTFVQRV